MICSKPLEYYTAARQLRCVYCGRSFTGYISCPEGHSVCEQCHNRVAVEKALEVCLASRSTDPVEIFNEVLALGDVIPMLGCHHAFMVAGALLSAVRNSGVRGIGREVFDEVFSRTSNQAIGGYCGLTGVCGIVPAVGAVFSVLLGARCGSDREQRFVMEVVSEVAREVAALTGPSCCKAYSWRALEVASSRLKELGIELKRSERPVCRWSDLHPHGCRKELCPYYAG